MNVRVYAYVNVQVLIYLHSLSKKEDILHERRELPAVADLV